MDELIERIANEEDVSLDDFLKICDDNKWKKLYYRYFLTDRLADELYDYCIEKYENEYDTMNTYIPLFLASIVQSKQDELKYTDSRMNMKIIKYYAISMERGNSDAMVAMGDILKSHGEGFFEINSCDIENEHESEKIKKF